MATQSPSTSSASRVLDRITEERFTGLLRVSAHEASGEFWFLAGILDEGRFGVSKGEEARERLLRATQTRFQAELRLPHVSAGFKKPMPASGSFADFRPVVLMRHCESCALTCSLELKGKDRTVRLTYRIGELTSVDSEAGNDALPSLLESDQGTYEFSLPAFELPEGSSPPPAAPKIPLAERVDRLLADEASDAEAKRKAEEAAAAEAKRKAEEAAAAEAKRKAEEAAAAEAKRKAEEAAAAEAKRKAEEAAAAEAKRKAEEAAAAEAKRKAEEAKRKAEQAAAEAKRKAEEAKRKAEEAAAAEAKRKAEEEAAEAQRKAEEEAAAEAKRKAAEAESKRKADKERAAATSKGTTGAKPKGSSQRASRAGSSKAGAAPLENTEQGDEQLSVPTRKGGFPWPLLLLAFVLLGLAYLLLMRSGVR